MLHLGGQSPQLGATLRAGSCALLGTLPRILSALTAAAGGGSPLRRFSGTASSLALAAEPLSYPQKEAENFQYAVLRAPLSAEGQQAAHEVPRHLLPWAQRLGQLGGLRAASATTIYEAARSAAWEGQPLAVVLGTGGTEQAAVEVVRQYHREFCKFQQAAAGEQQREPPVCGTGNSVPPLLLVAHPFASSLPSALETLARLQQDGLHGRVVYLGSGAQQDEGWATLQRALQGVRVWHQLHRSRIGLVGAPSEWLVASTPSAGAVASSWGPSLVDIDMQELLSKLWDGGHWEKGEVDQVVQDMLQGGGLVRGHAEVGEAGKAGGCPSCGVPATVDAEPAAKVYLALRQLVDAHALACCTVRCFDVVSAKETTGCYSLARLLDEGVIAGCEGDVCSALGMLWGKLMTGQVPWMANVAQVDPAGGIVKLAHCTIARSLVKSYESDRGVAFKGAVPPGAVTLLRVGGRALDRLWVEEGYVLDDRQAQGTGTEWSPQLCRTQVRVRLLGGRPAVEELLVRPLGNHLVMLRGHQRALLEEWFTQFGPGTK